MVGFQNELMNLQFGGIGSQRIVLYGQTHLIERSIVIYSNVKPFIKRKIKKNSQFTKFIPCNSKFRKSKSSSFTNG
jgi:hypothetical protein